MDAARQSASAVSAAFATAVGFAEAAKPAVASLDRRSAPENYFIGCSRLS
jgi:hypothetical protein